MWLGVGSGPGLLMSKVTVRDQRLNLLQWVKSSEVSQVYYQEGKLLDYHFKNEQDWSNENMAA